MDLAARKPTFPEPSDPETARTEAADNNLTVAGSFAWPLTGASVIDAGLSGSNTSNTPPPGPMISRGMAHFLSRYCDDRARPTAPCRSVQPERDRGMAQDLGNPIEFAADSGPIDDNGAERMAA